MLQETARLIPRATLCEIDGGRHGMYELQKETFENAVLDFLHNGTGVA